MVRIKTRLRQSHEATHCPGRAWCEICVKAKSPDGKHTKQMGNPEHIPGENSRATPECQSTALIVTATPKGSKGSLERGERANMMIQGQFRAFRAAVSMKYKTEVGPDHVLMGWMVRHCGL